MEERHTYRTYMEKKNKANAIVERSLSSEGAVTRKDGDLMVSYDKIIDALEKRANQRRREIRQILNNTEDMREIDKYRKELDIYEFEIPMLIDRVARRDIND